MATTQPGLHESLLTRALEAELETLRHDLRAELTALSTAEAADRIALHVGRVLERAIAGLEKKHRVERGIQVAEALIDTLDERVPPARDHDDERPVASGHLLRSIVGLRPDGQPVELAAPLTPLLDTTLLTNAPGEPGIVQQLKTEIPSADRIDLVMAFIRRSGIRLLKHRLRQHCQAGRPLRVLTTTYTESTEVEALEELRDLGAEVRVSYDTSSTRLHAKAWLFHRDSGYSTAYIGSSNLTYSAQVTGLEWNVRASDARNQTVIEKVTAVFDAYWHSGDFHAFDPAEFRDHLRPRATRTKLSPVEIRLEPFQDRLLEQIELARQEGHHRNLLVSATGTGKTVMAAVDFARLLARTPSLRLLFVAHRKEILEKSLDTFRHALRDANFGELWVDGATPTDFDHVFASIQSLTATGYASLKPDHFDVVVVDEFHHAAADSYQALLDHVEPRELLGLTATPERTDGLDVLHHFGGQITAELRLWDAIDQHRLSPFLYYGIHDGLDLTQIPWKRGRGYDVQGLTGLLTANDIWAKRVVASMERHLDDVDSIRALGFCVSVDHARFMARVFQDLGIDAVAVSGTSDADDRRQALEDLEAGRIRVLFSVDLFNEGVDVPRIDTLLFLRPTDSATLFLQQLGRGLRRADGKTVCTVLDFVGQHRREFRFDKKLRALLGGTRKELERHVENGFPLLPAGCHMELDRKSQEEVLRSIKQAVPSRWPSPVHELTELMKTIPEPSLGQYLAETGLELTDVYNAAARLERSA